jgi:hypothetical protein
MAFMAFDMGDKTDAASIMLVGGVIEAILLGVLDFGFDVVLVFHSALLMNVAGIGLRRDTQVELDDCMSLREFWLHRLRVF